MAASWMLAVAAATPAAATAKPSLPKNALPVPITPQATSYSCGAAALLSTLVYWRAFSGNEIDLHEPLETTPKDGTEPEKIAEVARALGLNARIQRGMTPGGLRTRIQSGDTVILDLQAWRDPLSTTPWKDTWEDGHYVVAVAMDDRHVYVMDPSISRGYAYLPIPELMERWHDYENRHGTVTRNIQLGILISGSKPIASFPAPLTRMR